jgi:hypothetical protein
VFGFRLKNYQWVHVVLAGGSVGLSGCVDRAYDFGLQNGPSDSEGDSDGTTGGPTDPTNPSDPSDPTVDPTDPPPGIPGPPQLIDVRFLDNLTLALTFNEPMQSPLDIDPSAFRLSLGSGGNFEPYYGYGYQGYKWTFYNDLRNYSGEQVCNEYCWDYCYDYYDPYCYDGGYCYEFCYSTPGPRILPFALRLDEADPARIILGLDNGISAGVCDRAQSPGPEYVEGLFLHYTDKFTPVVDSQGELLAPIAQQWALQPEVDYLYTPNQFFPEMNPFLPIPCPF